MNKTKTMLLTLFMVMLLASMAFFGFKAYENALAYEAATVEVVAKQDAGSQAKLQLEKLAKSILGPLYEDSRQQALSQIKSRQTLAKSEAIKYTYYFMTVLSALLLGYFFLSLRLFSIFASLGTLMTLFLGLITPILMVTIHKEVDYLGDVVLSFESKGVLGSIGKLFDNGDMVIALVILLFSVLIPVLKVTAMLFVSLFVKSDFAHGIVKFFKMIGKWSMVDVFVVATFLVYLTVDKGDVSRAEVEVGLYFFLAYVLVSMLVSLVVDKLLHGQKEKVH